MDMTTDPANLAPLETLPQELLSNIIDHLEPNNRASFLRASKRLYHATHPHLWHTLKSNDSPRKRHAAARYSRGLYKIAKIAEDIGIENMGFVHVKKVVFKEGDLTPEKSFAGTDPGLHKLSTILEERLAAGVIKLQQVELCWEDIARASTGATNLLETLKGYQKLTLPQKPSIIAKKMKDSGDPKGPIIFPIRAFALECITNLELAFGGEQQEFGVLLEQTVNDIELFTDTLKGTTSLQYLSLEWRENIRDTPSLVIELPQLKELQSAITDLKQLRGLGLTGYLFHPSFLIIPPENTKKLTIKQEVSIAWWRKFAKHAFTGVEDLTMDTRHAGTELISDWLSGDEEEVRFFETAQEFTFLLGELAITGLKRLSTYTDYYYCPDDFLALLRQNNPGLQEFTRYDGLNI
ncbi:hypothetical protein TWF106_001500 [Orbilia oligospora]|uniref:F-box domain-containing protein n=1 Tax=Orbilia oligospora TaxID=2813651 RepID=A0A7C8KDB9_ORBOL|nr:hypothetical protein TWF788_010397 [Orbilia oligospora]KAF3204617.1 hypothetical protein TWF106_001500 [Orbilia oligospora]